MTKRMKEIGVRTLSGAVLAAVTVGAVLLSPYTFGALLCVMLVGCLEEFYRMARRTGCAPQPMLGTALALAIFAAAFLRSVLGGQVGSPWVVAAALCAGVLTALVFIRELYRHERTPIGNIASTLMGAVMIGGPLALLCFIPELGDDAFGWNPWVVLGYFLVVWANDVFAFLTGIAFGRHRMIERISPKKSWEGFAGGIAAAIGIGALVGCWLPGGVGLWAGLGGVAALSGVAGDLVESMFKRSVGLKDSGRIMPGHGGWLDRFDALLMSAPFVCAYLFAYRNLLHP